MFYVYVVGSLYAGVVWACLLCIVGDWPHTCLHAHPMFGTLCVTELVLTGGLCSLCFDAACVLAVLS